MKKATQDSVFAEILEFTEKNINSLPGNIGPDSNFNALGYDAPNKARLFSHLERTFGTIHNASDLRLFSDEARIKDILCLFPEDIVVKTSQAISKHTK